jgi:deoxyribose-phosphate aldolase
MAPVSARFLGAELAAWRPEQGPRRIADFVDHTLLKAEAARTDILKLCEEAKRHRFTAVCVNPFWVPLCSEELLDSGVTVATVCGFPLGATCFRAKAFEAAEVVRHGAVEVDMVAAIGRMKSGEWGYVTDDIRAVVEAVAGTLVKVIVESAALTPDETVRACQAAQAAGAHFVKTSTGFHPSGGASVEAVRLMRRTVGDELGVKASGGIRDCGTALRMLAAGASRIGTSSGVALAECLGPDPLPLGELLADPARHAASCRTAPRG